MEKYGFIYCWYDKKRDMKYIGCHWGTEDDGYKCSSKRLSMAMLKSKRAGKFEQRFKREILKTGIEKESLLIEEYKFLREIPKEELGKQYYNLRTWLFPNNIERKNSGMTGKQHSPKTNKTISNKVKNLWQDPEYKEKQSIERKIRWENDEYRKKMSDNHLGQVAWNVGKPHSTKTKKKLKLVASGRKWITNGIEDKRIKIDEIIPEGWNKGRINGKRRPDCCGA